ncbi:ComF family protein [Aerosticca soli]|uniref:Competence protein F homolog, phosphoribosyltransferase domain n=1 Tax=Aerosticca soli TaxID=2010829 RepID=A0A2Z6E1W4_9GAMM|nr:ComF family protein [Aerosticca soli]MDI3258911.1 ComF family protein [Nevskiaceae bacterium]BBD78990.1 competence protein F homolog, phosphoribosyltransferase domain [Aerosticca soli]
MWRVESWPARLGAALQGWVLPWRCLLCGARGTQGLDLCPACLAELPRNLACCARCALPLPTASACCGRCLRDPPPWQAAWSPFRYAWPLDRLEARFKFGGDLAAGRTLARLWAMETPPLPLPQWIVPVPLSRRRLRGRGYNQALELARVLGRQLGVSCRPDLLRRNRDTAAQTGLDAAGRRRNVRDAFSARAVRGVGHVAVLDDVFTTGATLAACTRALRRAGVARVDVWALARASAGRS